MLINCIQRQVKCLKYGEFHDQFLAFPPPPPAPKSTMSMYSYDSEFYHSSTAEKKALSIRTIFIKKLMIFHEYPKL